MRTRSVHYSHVAWCYDFFSSAYSLGAIGRAKRWHVARVSPGERVLYVGAGTGREVAVACAAQSTIEVVCIEPCAAMARRLRRRLSPWAERVTIVEQPMRAAECEGMFDWVCGHFFFNVFDAETMPGVLAMAATHVKPGGRLVVADFAGGCQSPKRQRGAGCATESSTASLTLGALSLAGSFVRAAYYRPINLAGWGLRMCALHPIYDYAALMPGLGFVVEERVGFATVPGVPGVPGVPAFYKVVCARKERGG